MIINQKKIAGVNIFQIEVSEDQLDVYGRCMKYILENFNSDEIEEICGAYDHELSGIYDKVANLLKEYTDMEFWQE